MELEPYYESLDHYLTQAIYNYYNGGEVDAESKNDESRGSK
jgi:hypothetical protein